MTARVVTLMSYPVLARPNRKSAVLAGSVRSQPDDNADEAPGPRLAGSANVHLTRKDQLLWF
jgi:hypothetical protein